MRIDQREWEGMGILIVFPHTSSFTTGQGLPTRTRSALVAPLCEFFKVKKMFDFERCFITGESRTLRRNYCDQCSILLKWHSSNFNVTGWCESLL